MAATVTTFTNNIAEAWMAAYQAFQNVNFSAWDYNTIKQSLVDYLKLNFQEDFNDMIENSEVVIFIETFAYLGELLAYRYDLNAHENFITVANRKESVLRLAQALSYPASRNIPARGLVRITSVTTTESVFDSNGNNLSNVIIFWNDPNNTNWKEQFILVINRILEQNFGTVLPSDRIQVQDVVFELYGLNNQPTNNGVPTIPYNITVSGSQYPMELVSSSLDSFGVLENTPTFNAGLNIVYLNDGLGDSSNNTGFFFYTKQGTMQRTVTTFDGVTPNQTYTVAIENSNQTDVWLNNINPNTNILISNWQEVDLENGQNILFNTNANMNKFQVNTLDNDEFQLVFGDGQFANIPNGTFEIWSRTSANVDLVIPTNSIQNLSASVFYLDSSSNQQTFTVTFSLVDTIQNAAPTETIDHIRKVAPLVYYTQDRMVNGADYNQFMLQDNTILKLRSINRTFAGDSRYIAWFDPTANYSNLKLYGNDLAVYFDITNTSTVINNSSLPAEDGGANIARINALIDNYIQPLLSTQAIVMKELLAGVRPVNVRSAFNANEVLAIEAALTTAINSSPTLFFITYQASNDTWVVSTTAPNEIWITVSSYSNGNFLLGVEGTQIVAHSDNMEFFVTNNGAKVLDYDTLNTGVDTLVLLQANIGTSGILTQNYNYFILQQAPIDGGASNGNPSTNDLVIIPADDIQTGIPDDVTLDYLINPTTDFVYFQRMPTTDSSAYTQWFFMPPTVANIAAYNADLAAGTGLWKKAVGKANLNFAWIHLTPNFNLIDPSTSNIIDTYIVTRGYYTALRAFLSGLSTQNPTPPTPFDLTSTYGYLLGSKMISDTVVLHPGIIKLIIGQYAIAGLQASLKVVKKTTSTLTDNQVKTAIVTATLAFFAINQWEFGETFYFMELTTYIKNALPNDISSIVIVPLSSQNVVGDLQQIYANDNEIIQPSITVNDIQIVQSIDPRTLITT
jgi:hypothetical protein